MYGRTVYTSLRRRADFQRLHAQGRRKGDTVLQVRALPTPSQVPLASPLRLGILVSKKYGSAVERNRFKRIVRAALRSLREACVPGWDILILPREARGVKMPEIRDALRRLLSALGVTRDTDPRRTEGD